LAEMDGRTDAAFDGYMQAYRFAGAIGRGGLSMDFVTSIACRALVLRHFKSLIPSLSHDQRDEALRLVERIEREQESPELVARRLRRWQHATYGLRGQIDKWSQMLGLAWQLRSLALFAPQRSFLAKQKLLYQQQSMQPVCDSLRLSPESDGPSGQE
jgi:hypothetical protein